MNKLKKIFKKDKNIIIGAIHFPPLLGYVDFPGLKIALNNALKDLTAFEKGGVDGIIFENNYDIPHKIFADSSVVASMTYLGEQIKKAIKLPLGISVLWNDYYTALSIAKILNLQFIRIPVFVDNVKTDYGIINGKAKEIIKYKKTIGSENIALFTDIHVKHAKLLSKNNIIVSAKLAVKNHSDAIIVTGKWTGQSPSLEELKLLRNSIGSFPILVGSGTDKNNIKPLLEYANGAIVSTSLKKGTRKKEEINVKSYTQRIDINKVKSLTKILKK
ncbi:BtpA/SgcQ family protein [Patescibacteria group bacterium]|nr:BtpA/SgcQ family protein [Patescibacteria group bacterium]